MPILLLVVAFLLVALAGYSAMSSPTVVRDPAAPDVLLADEDSYELYRCKVISAEYHQGRIVALVVVAPDIDLSRDQAPPPVAANTPPLAIVPPEVA